jgi:putative exosortase-associated protein (TIGR04073 family)
MVLMMFALACFVGTTLTAKPKEEKVPEQSVDAMGAKMVRGIVNIGTGWGEFPRQIVRSGQDDGILLAVPYGLARGLAMTLVRTMYGVAETVFFYIPFDGDYSSSIKPDYVWQKEPEKKK